MINYGPDLDNNNTIFNYVKVYKNRVEMEKDKNNNNVLVGSYVLIDYDRDADSDADSDYEDFNTNFEIDQDKYDTDPAFSIVGYDSTVWQKRYKNNTYIYEMVADLNLAASLGKQELNQQAILTSNQKGWISTAIPSEAGDNWIEVTVDTEGQLKIQHDKLNNKEIDNITTSQETVKIPIIKYDSKGHVVSIDEGTVELATVEELEEEQNRAQQVEETILASTGDDWIQVSKNENKLNIEHIKPNEPIITTTVKDGINIPVVSYDRNGHIVNVENQQITTENNWIYVGGDNKLRHKQQTNVNGTYGKTTAIPQITVDNAGHVTTIVEQNLPVSTSLNDENLSNLATIGQVQEVQKEIPQTTDELEQGTSNLYVSQEEKDAWNKKTSLEGYATEEYVDQAIADINLPTQDELLPKTFEGLEAYYADEEGKSLNIITEDELVQSNYEENDETKLSYIQNRPFYEIKNVIEDIIPTNLILNNSLTTLSETTTLVAKTQNKFYNYLQKAPLNFFKKSIKSLWILNSEAEDISDWFIEEKLFDNFPEATIEWNGDKSGIWLYLYSNHNLGFIMFSYPSNENTQVRISNMRNTLGPDGKYYQQIYGITFNDFIVPLDNKFLNLAEQYYTIDQIDEQISNIDEQISNIDEKIINTNYEENDSTSLSYIKNRPFYGIKEFSDIGPTTGNPIGYMTEEFVEQLNTATSTKQFLLDIISAVYWQENDTDDIISIQKDSLYKINYTPIDNGINHQITFYRNQNSFSQVKFFTQSREIKSPGKVRGIIFSQKPIKKIDSVFLPGSLLPEPTALADNTIPIVSNGAWTTTILTFAEEAEF